MKKALKKKDKEIHYFLNGIKEIIDRNNKGTYPDDLYGEISKYLHGIINDEISSDLHGTLSEHLCGIISNIYGTLSEHLHGDISYVFGDCTGISGNLDECELTEEDRKKGVNIEDLIK